MDGIVSRANFRSDKAYCDTLLLILLDDFHLFVAEYDQRPLSMASKLPAISSLPSRHLAVPTLLLVRKVDKLQPQIREWRAPASSDPTC